MGYITLSLQHWTQLPLDRVYNQDFFLKIHLELGFKVHFFFFFLYHVINVMTFPSWQIHLGEKKKRKKTIKK